MSVEEGPWLIKYISLCIILLHLFPWLNLIFGEIPKDIAALDKRIVLAKVNSQGSGR